VIDGSLEKRSHGRGQWHKPAIDVKEDVAAGIDQFAEQVDGSAVALVGAGKECFERCWDGARHLHAPP
jgi:hypothetical protein